MKQGLVVLGVVLLLVVACGDDEDGASAKGTIAYVYNTNISIWPPLEPSFRSTATDTGLYRPPKPLKATFQIVRP